MFNAASNKMEFNCFIKLKQTLNKKQIIRKLYQCFFYYANTEKRQIRILYTLNETLQEIKINIINKDCK